MEINKNVVLLASIAMLASAGFIAAVQDQRHATTVTNHHVRANAPMTAPAAAIATASEFTAISQPAAAEEGTTDSAGEAFGASLSGTFHQLVCIEDLLYLLVDSRGGVPAVRLKWRQDFPAHTVSGATDYLNYLQTNLAGESREHTQLFRTSMAPRDIVARDYTDIFIAGNPVTRGLPDVSRIVIERWRLTYPGSSLVATREEASTAIGVPRGYEPCGLAYETPFLPCDEAGEIVEAREVIYMGTALANLSSMVADPDGRYLLIAESDGDLHQLDLVGSSGVQLIGSSSGSAGLANCAHLTMSQHEDLGRVLVAARGALASIPQDDAGAIGAQARTVFVDADNDGVFESSFEIPDGQWFYSPVRDRARRIDGFVDQVDALYQ